MIDICVIGVGKIFQLYHLNSILKLQNVKIKYVVDTNKQLAIKIAKQIGAIPLSDARDIKGCKLCLISTPPSTRLSVFESVKNSKMDLIFEKPIAFDLKTADYIFKESIERGLKVYVAQTRRFFPNIIFIRELLRNNAFSFPIKIAHYEGGIFNWITESNYMNNKNKQDQGVVHDMGAHVFDYLMAIVDDLKLKYEDISIDNSSFDFDSLANNCFVKFHVGETLDVTVRLSRNIMMANKLIISDSNKTLISKPGYDNKIIMKMNNLKFEVPINNEYYQGKDLDDAFDLMWKTIVNIYTGDTNDAALSIECNRIYNSVKFLDDVINFHQITPRTNFLI